VLNLTRAMIHWRKHLPALVQGDIQVAERDDEVVEFTRTYNGQTLWVALNMGQSAVDIQPPAGAQIIREAFLSSDTESLAPLTGTVWSL
jgi:glycosidase